MGDEPIEVVLARFDGRLANIEAGQKRMEASIDRQSYVENKLYTSEQSAQDKRIDAAMALSMWALGLVCSTVIVAVVSLVVKLATA